MTTKAPLSMLSTMPDNGTFAICFK